MIRLLQSSFPRALAAVAILLALAVPTGTRAQYPTDLYSCMPPFAPNCFVGGGGTIYADCRTDPPTERIFLLLLGYAAWYPLRCVGPITVTVGTFALAQTRFPLYVEVVPLPEHPDNWGYVCADIPGHLILTLYGESYASAPCGTWDEAGPFDITRVIPIGSLYALRLYFFSNLAGFSPAVDCIRVTAHPVDRSPVVSSTWGRVKELYQ